ncbi:hypothetical protein [Mediterraneibacter massiliensis]|uniref:hypothetical protein n=1 Tax=Mediterraneibacter massiliensis TaxID=1720300 RepID=UPI0022E6A256|nr:hypothetical protein [Mediterraneibacter massiliensis]
MHLMLKKELSREETLAFGYLLYLNIVLQLVESVVPFPFSIFKIVYCMSLLFAVKIIICNICSFKNLLVQMLEMIGCIKGVLICFVLYIAYDLFTFIYTADKMYAAMKYIVVLEMVGLAFLWLFYLVIKGKQNIEKDMNLLLGSFVAVELIVSIIAVINYRLEIFPLLYYRRLSTCKDYNQFGTLILLGYIAGVWLLLKNDKIYWKKYIELDLFALFSLTVLYLVSSRRNFLLMIGVTIVFCIYLFIIDIFLFKGECFEKIKKCILLFGLSVAVFWISTNICEKAQQLFYERYVQAENNIKEGKTTDNMESILSGDFLKKRLYIWGIAADEIKNFDGKECLFGKGASYQSDIYDFKENKTSLMTVYHLKEEPKRHWMYTHNFVLSDMLSGGICKVGISFMIICSIAYSLIKNLKKYHKDILFLIMLFGIVYVNAFISYPFGYISDKNYWFVLFTFILFNINIAKENRHAIAGRRR